jgi:DNA-binding response OmpR family regulator
MLSYLSDLGGNQMAKILVVDDSENIRRLVASTLERNGYDVVSYENGFEVIKNVDSVKPDLIIADIMMPKLDGLKMLMALKNRQETKNIPLVFLTSKSDVKSVAEGINLGAKCYLTKPIVLDELLSTVKSIVKE